VFVTNEYVNRTQMTRMRRIITEKAKKISVDTLYPRHPRSIIPYTDMKTALVASGRRQQ
jgi:hypothetical protein